MKNFWRVAGILLLALGLVWIASILGGVFSHTPGYTTISGLWGGLAFHTVCMLAGMFCMGMSYAGAQQAPAVVRPQGTTPAANKS